MRVGVQLVDCRLSASRGVAIAQQARVFREGLGVFGEHQNVLPGAVLEVIVDAFFFAEPVQPLQIILLMLLTMRAGRVGALVEFEAVVGGTQTMAGEQSFEDFRDAQVVERPTPGAAFEQCQAGAQHHLVVTQVRREVTAADFMDESMNAFRCWPETEKRRLFQQRLQVQSGIFAQQLDFEAVGLVQGLAPTETNDVQGRGEGSEGQ